jgi:hypothetical protein
MGIAGAGGKIGLQRRQHALACYRLLCGRMQLAVGGVGWRDRSPTAA